MSRFKTDEYLKEMEEICEICEKCGEEFHEDDMRDGIEFNCGRICVNCLVKLQYEEECGD